MRSTPGYSRPPRWGEQDGAYNRGTPGFTGAWSWFAPFDFTFRAYTFVPHVAYNKSNSGAAEAQVRHHAVGGRDDPVHPPGLVAELNPHPRRKVEPASA